MKSKHFLIPVLALVLLVIPARAEDATGHGIFSIIREPEPFGLDLEGPFAAAIALGAGPDDVWKVGDAEFRGFNSEDEAPVYYDHEQITVSSPSVHWIGRDNENFIQLGASPDAENLAKVLNGYRIGTQAWGFTLRLIISGLNVGQKYQIQLLFHEPFMNGSTRGSDERTFSIRFGQSEEPTVAAHQMETLVQDFNMMEDVGGFASVYDTALVWTYEFEAEAARGFLDLVAGEVNKPVLNGFTLKELP